jgi:MoaA/NifB/PqqE/SkfB family radical SAM enzyme
MKALHQGFSYGKAGNILSYPGRTDGDRSGRESSGFVFSQASFRVYWEMTRACGLACRHCRAEANPERDRREMSTIEGESLLERIRAFGGRGPHLLMTGGDPLKRPDLFSLIEYGSRLGLTISIAPSGTNALTAEVLKRFRAAGVESIALSLDGSTAEKHEGQAAKREGCSGCHADKANHNPQTACRDCHPFRPANKKS